MMDEGSGLTFESLGQQQQQQQTQQELVEIKKSQGSPSKGPFAITTYARVRAQTNVMGTANENSSSFENSQDILRKVGKNKTNNVSLGYIELANRSENGLRESLATARPPCD